MKEFELKYGCNPNQKPARIFMSGGQDLPIEILNGRPGYINFLDAFNSWQLVKELCKAVNLPCATSFKHVSPTSAAVGKKLDQRLKKACFVDDIEGLDDSLLASAYARARGTDRMSSFGDFVALSHTCDEITAKVIAREVCDGVIAPNYSQSALKILKQKRKGTFNIIKIDKDYEPQVLEQKQVFGITFEQNRNNAVIDETLFSNIVTKNKNLPSSALEDLIVAMITLKYTQSNSVCFSYDGQAIGVGAGQQSRIHCVRLAAQKADLWHLRQLEKTLSLQFAPNVGRPEKNNIIDIYLSDDYAMVAGDGVWHKYFAKKPEPFTKEEKQEYLKKISGVALASDAFFPFSDNIERAKKSGVSYVAEPGGSIRDDEVIKCCDKYDMVMAFTGLRLFHH
ncbi:MAG: phosphoribosylaminoimidazolecarboxamide formyltransferase [Clostridiales bacterium]|nr:phosphoribosylaminoimidazolecarboxamide formyltransferase [Clostridiales bacterium]